MCKNLMHPKWLAWPTLKSNDTHIIFKQLLNQSCPLDGTHDADTAAASDFTVVAFAGGELGRAEDIRRRPACNSSDRSSL